MSSTHRRFALPLVAYAFAVTMFGATLPTPLYPIYRKQLDLSELMVTVIYAAYAIAVIAALIVVGRWSDQLGRRRMLFAGLAFSAAGAVAFLSGSHLASLFIGRVLSGISVGIFTGTATVMLVELAPEDRRGHATLIAAAVNMGGLGLGPLIAGVLAQYAPLPLRLTFLVDLGLLAIAAGGVWYAPETVKVAERPELGPEHLRVPAPVRAAFIPASIAGFAGFAVMGLFTGVAPAIMGQLLQISNLALVGAVVFAIFAASTMGQAALGHVPKRWAFPGGCLVMLAGAGLLGGAIGTASLALLVASAVVVGLGQGLSFRAGLAAVTQVSPADRRCEIVSTFFVVLYVANSIPVIGLGVMTRFLGLRLAGIGFTAAMALLALIALVLTLRHPGNTRANGERH